MLGQHGWSDGSSGTIGGLVRPMASTSMGNVFSAGLLLDGFSGLSNMNARAPAFQEGKGFETFQLL